MRNFVAIASLLAAGSTVAVAQGPGKPIDVSLGWNYSYTDEGTGFADLNGWYGVVNWEAGKRAGVAFEHESFWGSFQGQGANQHVWLLGSTVKLREGNVRVSPYVQPMAGATRSKSTGSVEWEPTLQLGAGADITLKGSLSLELVPAEYTFTYGSRRAENTFQAGAGLQYTFGKKS